MNEPAFPGRTRAAAAVLVIALVAVLVYWLWPSSPRPVAATTAPLAVPAAPVDQAANELLAQLDSGDYEAVFDQMASRFKEGTERDHFVAAMRAVRAPLGSVRER